MGLEKRLELDAILTDLLGSSNVYFQPPLNVQLKYPAIVYSRDTGRVASADNQGYRFTQRYSVTYIDKDPDNDLVDVLATLKSCTPTRSFVSDGLSHDVFSLYY